MIEIILLYIPGNKDYPLRRYLEARLRALKKYLDRPYRVNILTNADEQFPEDARILSIDNFGGKVDINEATCAYKPWWNKLEMFKPGLFQDDCLYMDLDDYIISDINWLADHKLKEDEFLIPYDYLFGPISSNSSIVKWHPGKASDTIYTSLIEQWPRVCHMRSADQHYIEYSLRQQGLKFTWIQDVYPGKVLGYKFNYKKHNLSLDGVSMVICPAHPKPHEIDDPKLNSYLEAA